MVADHDLLDPLDPFGIQIMLVRIEDARPGTDPDPISNLQTRLGAQMTAVEKSFAPDPDSRPRKRKDDDGREVGAKPRIGADLDMRALRDRDMQSSGSPLGVDTLADREPRTRRKGEMGRSEIGGGVGCK